jgi:hypothetical protein
MDCEYLKKRLAYDRLTGIFTWREKIAHCRYEPGDIAGRLVPPGYWTIWMHDKDYLAHRLAWLYMTGEWPNVIDHVNGQKSDNRFANLRNVDDQTNNQNVRIANSNSHTGFLGVDCDPNRKTKYRAKIVIDKKPVYLGRFKTPEEAHARYLEAKRQMHPGCTI